MLSFLGFGQCGRPLYFAILALLVLFDFAKGPIERTLARTADGAVQAMLPPVSAQPGPLPSFSQGVGGSMAKGAGTAALTPREEAWQREQILRKAMAFEERGGTAPSLQDEARQREEILKKALAFEAKRTAVQSGYLSALVALGLVTLVAMIRMTFARVNDIGWPAWVAFVALAPALLLRLYGGHFPDALFHGVQLVFIGGLVALGLVPSGTGRGDDPQAPPAARPPRAVLPRTPPQARAAGQFGRRA